MHNDEFGNILIHWYQEHRRDLPWRSYRDPYVIWLSEIILQQTRIEQGLPYFEQFLKHFPSVQDLAAADEDLVLKLWQGLGYYSRARNLHFTAEYITDELEGRFPKTYKELLKLKGVGKYTAAAIASIAYEERVAVVDGNVIRVIARLYGINKPVDDPKVKTRIEKIAQELLKAHQPSEFNQGMMEFGALHCTPRQAKCGSCPFATSCIALQANQVSELPFKQKKIKRRSRYLHFLVVTAGDKTLIDRRGNDDIWRGLFQFPLIESESDLELSDREIQKHLQTPGTNILRVNKVGKHVLSHQDLHARFYHLSTRELPLSTFRIADQSELHTFALPRLIDRYLENYRLTDGKKRV